MSQHAGLVNFATSSVIWDWPRLPTMRGRGASRTGLPGRGQLPRETRAYVRIITGRAAEEWVGVPEEIQHDRPTGPCTQATKKPPKVESHISVEENASWGLWGLQLISNSSEIKALAEYKQLQKRYQSVLGDRAPPSRRIFPATSQPTLLAVDICWRKLPRFSQLRSEWRRCLML